jgi:1,4-dihydroxy-2-naphthoyl-CoA synthase
MSPIKTYIEDGILQVTLDRPKANAIDLATSKIMGETFAAFRDDPSLRVAIITGAGDKFFCPRLGSQSRRRWGCGGWRLRRRRFWRLAGVA